MRSPGLGGLSVTKCKSHRAGQIGKKGPWIPLEGAEQTPGLFIGALCFGGCRVRSSVVGCGRDIWGAGSAWRSGQSVFT